MKTVTAREANQRFSDLLNQVETGSEVLITKHGRPVAVLRPYRPTELTPERQQKVDYAMALMAEGLPWPNDMERPTRDEMHKR